MTFVGSVESYDCPDCATRYHRDCADELGGCSTLGCPRLGVGPDEEKPDDQRWRARVHRYRDGARARRASGRRLRQEHVAEAQAEGETALTGWQVATGCLDCLSILAIFAVALVTAGLALAI